MSTFIVKTTQNRNLVIEADSFFNNRDGVYVFTNEDGDVVAEVPINPNILAVVEQDAEQEDFYFSDHEADDEFHHFDSANAASNRANGPEDETLECGAPVFLLETIPLLAEFLDCPLVQEALEEAGLCVCTCAEEPEFIPDEPKVEHRKTPAGGPIWGITCCGKFYPLGDKEFAEENLQNNMSQGYWGAPIEDCPLVEE
jgi:hypothetical protein